MNYDFWSFRCAQVVPDHALRLDVTFTYIEVPRKFDLEGLAASRTEAIRMRDPGAFGDDAER